METLSKFLYWKPYSNVHDSTCLGWMSFAAFIVKKKWKHLFNQNTTSGFPFAQDTMQGNDWLLLLNAVSMPT